jgi:acyl-coenzyme A synthetase/AMP-(fatty) acid ligase
MPEVSMSAVIGVPDDTLGERVHAIVVLRPGATVTAADVTEMPAQRGISRCVTALGRR